jgi:hypothetical protein
MLSPGDQVFLDGEESKGLQGRRWTVKAASTRGDLNINVEGGANCFYQFVDWPDPDEWVPSSRITSHWVET